MDHINVEIWSVPGNDEDKRLKVDPVTAVKSVIQVLRGEEIPAEISDVCGDVRVVADNPKIESALGVMDVRISHVQLPEQNSVIDTSL